MDNDKIYQIIKLYKQHRLLWDCKHLDYYNKNKREDVWREMSTEISTPVKELKKKVTSLLGSYRREKSREKKSKVNGSGEGDVYKSKWFAYTLFQFLSDKEITNDTADTMDNEPNSVNQTAVLKTQGTNVESSDINAEANNTNVDNAEIIMNKYPILSKRLRTIQDCQADEAYKILKEKHEKRPSRDESSIYGDYIASKHRKYSACTKSVVEHLIANILFNADMSRYDVSTTPNSYNSSLSLSSTPPPYHEQPSTSQDNPYFQQPKSVKNTTRN